MFYWRDNWVFANDFDGYVWTHLRNSELSKQLNAAIMSAIGIVPPFSAKDKDNTFSMSFFYEFDSRKLSDMQMEKVIKKLTELIEADGKYSVKSFEYTGTSLSMKYEALV